MLPGEQKQGKVEFQDVDLYDNGKVHHYLENQACNQAILVYASESLKEYLQQQELLFTDLDAGIDHKILRSLDVKVGEKFRVLVTTNKATSMRGIDYRSPTYGI